MCFLYRKRSKIENMADTCLHYGCLIIFNLIKTIDILSLSTFDINFSRLKKGMKKFIEWRKQC